MSIKEGRAILALQAIKLKADSFYSEFGGGFTLSEQGHNEENVRFAFMAQDFMNSIREQVYYGLSND